MQNSEHMKISVSKLQEQEPAIFSYDRSDIMLEVKKRSSYIGKMRGDENNPNFIDRMSLTDGESFLSDEMIEDAVEQVYEWLQAFGRGVDTPYDLTSSNIDFNLQPRRWWDRRSFGRVERYIKEALINYVLYRWFEFTNAAESPAFFAKYEDYAHKAQLGMNASDGTLERRCNTPFNTIYG